MKQPVYISALLWPGQNSEAFMIRDSEPSILWNDLPFDANQEYYYDFDYMFHFNSAQVMVFIYVYNSNVLV